MYKKFFLPALLVLVACTAKNHEQVALNEIERTALVQRLAVYLDDRPENVSGDARFDTVHRAFYAELVQQNEARLEQLVAQGDTLYFLYKKRDRRSLYEHYRFIGGKMVMKQIPEISYLDILFHTPRLTPEELDKGPFLFDKMVSGASLASMHGDMKYIEWPDADYGYDPLQRRWRLRASSKLNEVEYFREKKAD